MPKELARPEIAKNIWLSIGGVIVAIALYGTVMSSPFGSSEGNIAADTYRSLSSSWNPAQQCTEAGQVASAYLRDGDDANYKVWKEQETIACNSAAICRQLVGGC